jgi:hypothetical protein
MQVREQSRSNRQSPTQPNQENSEALRKMPDRTLPIALAINSKLPSNRTSPANFSIDFQEFLHLGLTWRHPFEHDFPILVLLRSEYGFGLLSSPFKGFSFFRLLVSLLNPRSQIVANMPCNLITCTWVSCETFGIVFPRISGMKLGTKRPAIVDPQDQDFGPKESLL